MGEKTVAIGRLARAHGVRGELLFLPWLEVEGALLPGLELTLEGSGGPGKKAWCLESARRISSPPPQARGPSSAEGPEAPGRAGRTPSKKRRKPRGEAWLLCMEGCTDRTAAEALVGSLVRISRDRLPPLPEGEYLWEDLLGLEVQDEGGAPLGRVVEIFPTGSNEVLVVRDGGGEEILLPAIREVIREVDLEGGRLRVRLMEGLRGSPRGKEISP